MNKKELLEMANRYVQEVEEVLVFCDPCDYAKFQNALENAEQLEKALNKVLVDTVLFSGCEKAFSKSFK